MPNTIAHAHRSIRELTLRDRLFHLTFPEAWKLFGAEGA